MKLQESQSTVAEAIRPPAERIKKLRSRLSAQPIRLPASAHNELVAILKNTAAYLEQRMAANDKLRKNAKSERQEVARVDGIITELKAKKSKSTADYATLSGVERSRVDVLAAAENAEERVEAAEDVLRAELFQFSDDISSLICNEVRGDLLDRAAKAVAPFCDENTSPRAFAMNLPAINAAKQKIIWLQPGKTTAGLLTLIRSFLKECSE